MKFLCCFFLAISTSLAADDRFGFATHFEAGWSPEPNVIPGIVATGAGWIRDDLYAGHWETSPGVYVIPTSDSKWMKDAHTHGLKVVGILGPNGNYADAYDKTAMANLAVWIAKSGLVDALEITNEPNNDYQKYYGSSWQTKLVALSNAVASAVHAIGSKVPVIGLGAQGDQILNMFSQGTTLDGVVYHPYANPDAIPEGTYEPAYYAYPQWISVLSSKTKLPKWETEWSIGTDSSYTGANQAAFIARRLLAALGLGVQHTFIYEYMDNGAETYGVVDGAQNRKPAYAVIQNILSLLQGLPATAAPTVNSVANGNTGHLLAYAFSGSSKTIAAYWLGYTNVRTPPPPTTCSLSFPAPNGVSGAYLLNVLTGSQTPLSAFSSSLSKGVLTISNLPLDDNPRLLILIRAPSFHRVHRQ
jgi:hypothetical protein